MHTPEPLPGGGRCPDPTGADSLGRSPGQVVSVASFYCTDELEERLPTTQRILTGEEEEECSPQAPQSLLGQVLF